MGIGVVWVILQGVALEMKTGEFAYDGPSISFGLLAGAFLFVSNILLLEAFTHIDVSLGSTIYRLNTVVVVLLAFFLLDESLSAMKVAGILFGVISIVFLYQRVKDGGGNQSEKQMDLTNGGRYVIEFNISPPVI